MICFPLVATGSISCRTSETPFDDIGGIGVCNSMSVCAGAINNSQAMRSGPVAFNYANFYAPLSRSGNWTVSSEVGLEAARSSLYSQHSMKLELTKHLDKVRDTVTEVDRTGRIGACQRVLDRYSRSLVSFLFWCPFQFFPRKFRSRKLQERRSPARWTPQHPGFCELQLMRAAC